MASQANGATTSTGLPELQHVLRVNLTEASITTEEVPQEYRNRFIAGKGLGAALLMDELEPDTAPLSEANTLLFMFGPLTGLAPGTSRYGAITKSPLTGAFVDSYSGGHFPATFRFAMPNYLGVIFEGKAANPVYLSVEDGEATLEDASALWGLDARETAQQFPEKNTKVAAIGNAGENLVKFATISSDEASHHAGRGGVGAVMGSKNLKAVVARSEKPFDAADLQDLRIEHTRRLASSVDTEWARTGGTPQIVDWTHEVGALPAHNWTRGTLEDVNTLNIDAFEPGHVGTDSCYSCPIACGHVTEFDGADIEGAYPEASVAWGPEYETVGMMGANTDITDVTAVTELADHADRLGMDSISLGNVLSWTMEVAERGLLDADISFGNAEAAVELVRKIAAREGIGDALAEGTVRAAEILCEGDEDARRAAVQVKGMEAPAYDPRASYSMGLAYATSDRGACHQRAFPIESDALGGERDPHSTEGHAEATIDLQNEGALVFSAIACDFTAYNYEYVAEWLNAMGYSITTTDLQTVGERAWTMTRLFNAREGLDRDDDRLPPRLHEPLQAGGPADGNRITEDEFETMLQEYYELRGWTAKGLPTRETIDRLGIADFIPQDYSASP